jgi:hypothetical protein
MTDVVAFLAKSGHVVAAATRRSGTNRPTPALLIGTTLSTRLVIDPTTPEGISLVLDAEEVLTALGDVPGKDLARLTTIGVDGAGDDAKVVPLENPAGIDAKFANNELVVTVASRPGQPVYLLVQDQGSYSSLETHKFDPTGKLKVTDARLADAIVCVPGMALKQV